ncbi:MAG: hypothetical protein ACLSHC_15660 [Bilophila wadsworthia]
MGGRLLEAPAQPLARACPFRKRRMPLHGLSHIPKTEKLRETLSGVYDLERLSTRIALNRTSPRDMLSLRQSLAALPPVKSAITSSDADTPRVLRSITEHWDDLGDHAATLQKALADDPPQFITEGGLFKQGYNAELDELLDLVEHGENRVKALLDEEQKASGISKLKLGYNRSSATTSSCPKPLAAHLPSIYRRQTLANAERFTTVRLKELEEKLLSAADRRKSASTSCSSSFAGHWRKPTSHIPVHGRHAGAAGLLAVAGGNGGAPQLVAPVLHTGQSSRSEKDVTLSSRASSGKPRSCPTIFIWMRTGGSC